LNKEKIVYVVHAIDTEGPLYESIDASFDRLNETFGYDYEPSLKMLKCLQNKEIDLNGNEVNVQAFLSNEKIKYLSTWDQIDQMLDEITSDIFRLKVPDSYGGGWIYNWFCLDHVGFSGINPRRRDIGYHNVQNHYTQYFRWKKDKQDLIQWHYHALSLSNDAHRAGSTYLNSDHIHQIITRKVIDYGWFPAAFRPGHHTERPDSHFFLEQWIPFDFGNDSGVLGQASLDVSQARYGDWRRAPKSWVPYQPSHDDYQIPGDCRRYIARCLPINEREYGISKENVEQAFDEADQHGASILAVTDHDFRNMKGDVEKVMNMMCECSKSYSHIKYRYANAIEAMRQTLGLTALEGAGIHAELKSFKTHSRLIVESENNIFGPQPFLALKTKGNSYHWQNFDFEGPRKWSYSFDHDNIPIDHISHLGIAVNSAGGVTEVIQIDVDRNQKHKNIFNAIEKDMG